MHCRLGRVCLGVVSAPLNPVSCSPRLGAQVAPARPSALKAGGGKGIPKFARLAAHGRSAVEVSLIHEQSLEYRQPEGKQIFCALIIDAVEPAYELANNRRIMMTRSLEGPKFTHRLPSRTMRRSWRLSAARMRRRGRRSRPAPVGRRLWTPKRGLWRLGSARQLPSLPAARQPRLR